MSWSPTAPCAVHMEHMAVLDLRRASVAKNGTNVCAVKSLTPCKASLLSSCIAANPKNMVLRAFLRLRSKKSSRSGTTVQRFRRASASRAKKMAIKPGWLCWKVSLNPVSYTHLTLQTKRIV
mgnify:CR=1 FL=1